MKVELIPLQMHGDERGSLVSLEREENIPFEIKRVYYLFNTKENVARGYHAHRALKQVVIAIKGSCRFTLDDGCERVDIMLNNPAQGLLIESFIWREMSDFSQDCILMVLADNKYDESDYIREYDNFITMVNKKVKIIIAGKNSIAIDVSKWVLDNIVDAEILAICNVTDRGEDGFQRSFKKFCQYSGIKQINLDDAYKINNAFFLSLEFDRIINPSKFNHQNIFNIHFSCLPKYKGMYTSAWPILNNEAESGVTLHKIDHGIDTGDILEQYKFPLDENETANTLYLKYLKAGTELVIRNIDNIINNKYVLSKQGSKASTYYSKKSIDYNNITLDFNKTAAEILSQVRAFTFRSYQLVKFGNETIFHGYITDSSSPEKPGTIIENSDRSFVLSTIDFDVVLFKDNFEKILEACKDKSVEYISHLVRTENVLFEKNRYGWSPIIVAAYYGNVDVIHWLAQRGADINDRNYKGTTVAMYYKNYMERSNDYSKVNSLIKIGLDLNLQDYQGLTVFDYLIQEKNTNLYNYLMECNK